MRREKGRGTFKSLRAGEKRGKKKVVGGERMSEIMVSAVVPSDSKVVSCWFFMPPIKKQRISVMLDIMTNSLIVEFGQNRNLNFSSILSSICAIAIE